MKKQTDKTSIAPVAIFTYNRLNTTKETFNALNCARLANETDVYVFSDGSNNENAKHKVDEVREYLADLKKHNDFKSFFMEESKNNKGVDPSIIEGVSKIINKYGKVIVLEDDIIVSERFLEYMNNALDYYQNDKNVFSIAGYCPNVDLKTNDVIFFPRAESWGWAIWQDRWDSIDWQLNKIDELFSSEKKIAEFNRGGTDLIPMLEANKEAWDLRTCYTILNNDKYVVYPPKSMVTNIGFSKDSTHFKGVTHKYDTIVDDEFIPNLVPFNYDANKCNIMKKFYDIPIYKLIGRKIKRIIKRLK